MTIQVELNDDELGLMLSLLDSVQMKGMEGMRKALVLFDNLKQAKAELNDGYSS